MTHINIFATVKPRRDNKVDVPELIIHHYHECSNGNVLE